jgi:transcriptional regulator with XRE-family HTH domain
MNNVIIPELAVSMGRKIERLRTLVRLSQSEFGLRIGGISKQAVSKLELSPKISSEKLEKVAAALGFTPEAVQHFNEDILVFFIENMHDQATAYKYNFQCTFNPLDKVVELYERLLQLERDKVQLLKNKLEDK